MGRGLSRSQSYRSHLCYDNPCDEVVAKYEVDGTFHGMMADFGVPTPALERKETLTAAGSTLLLRVTFTVLYPRAQNILVNEREASTSGNLSTQLGNKKAYADTLIMRNEEEGLASIHSLCDSQLKYFIWIYGGALLDVS